MSNSPGRYRHFADATQLDVELSCVGEVSIASSDPPTQLNTTSSCVAINGPLIT